MLVLERNTQVTLGGEKYFLPPKLFNNKRWGSLHARKKGKGLCPSLYRRIEEQVRWCHKKTFAKRQLRCWKICLSPTFDCVSAHRVQGTLPVNPSCAFKSAATQELPFSLSISTGHSNTKNPTFWTEDQSRPPIPLILTLDRVKLVLPPISLEMQKSRHVKEISQSCMFVSSCLWHPLSPDGVPTCCCSICFSLVLQLQQG